MLDNVAHSIMSAPGDGQKQRADFVTHCLHSTTCSRIPPANLDEQYRRPRQSTQKHNKIKHVNNIKEDMHYIGQLYMIMHVREGNSDRLFEGENADFPPSLSKHGAQRSGKNSDLLPCLELD